VVIVHPDHADRANRSGLWMRGPFDAGQGILVVPDPRASTEGEVHQISVEAVAHAFGHAFIARTSRLLPRREAAILDEGVANRMGTAQAARVGPAARPWNAICRRRGWTPGSASPLLLTY
jgi:hypothetical protein